MRRSLFIFIIAALIAFGVYRWFQLGNRLHSHSQSEPFTPAAGPRVDPKDLQVLAALDSEYTRLVQAVVPSVVSITTTRNAPNINPSMALLLQRLGRGNLTQPTHSLGSGVIVSSEGHILTNHHVIANMDEILVQLTDGRTVPAQVIGSDQGLDIAVLKINADKLEPLPFGDSDSVSPGQLVFAVGNPFGLQETVTQGIVSAKGRAVKDSVVELLQTDAAVNPGNSGGPLLNVKGEIIGINSSIFSSSDGTWLGISFAIPSNLARHALESVLKKGRIVRGYLGISMVDNTPEIAKRLGLSDAQGVVIAEVVPNSPAAKAGLKPYDLIRGFNGHSILNLYSLRSHIAEVEVDSKVELRILRGTQEMTITANIEEAPMGLSRGPIPIQR
ncbi:2-alkenal reductase [Chthoniobacter flavus Ellin428]|uniref:2-alkenal reductase n=1 Tax=Chthoniobacter flavus Ellin428 TaxID=497964 RepID=B4D2B8_9BACT|nr:trypsin-like peptidase domain-containing protein [Chthoniobacter flavus]EDY19358.1 2-alkenal reductase [Chthoniobacter flavus Ellin428]TCO90512.1 Do/DeqQ family serine protease [Chthoniobacter flavus]